LFSTSKWRRRVMYWSEGSSWRDWPISGRAERYSREDVLMFDIA